MLDEVNGEKVADESQRPRPKGLGHWHYLVPVLAGDRLNLDGSGPSLRFLVLIIDQTAKQTGSTAHSRADGRRTRGRADESSTTCAYGPAA